MGFNNPDVSWRELERTLSDRARTGRPKRIPEGANGGDSPAWSPTRSAYVPPSVLARRVNATPYAELHCHSTFSFLDGASHPEELAEEAARLGLEALAITDHDGFYGVVRFAEAARAVGVPTVFGSELSLGLTKPQNGVPDPEGTHLLVLARDPEGYARLAATISAAQLAGAEKGKPIYEGIAWEEVHGDHWLVLTGCRKGTVPAALERLGPAAAARELDALVVTFGRHNVAVELCDHGDPLDSHRNDALAQLAIHAGVDVVATTNAHYATPTRRPLATAMAAVRARRSLDELDGWLPACAGAHLRSGDEQARRFARWPGAVERAAELGRACAFDLQLVAPQLPPFPCPDGLSEMAYLRRLTAEGAQRRYGTWGEERVPGAYRQIEHELALIEQLGFPGYFLVVWDIVDFCRRSNIYCQGRGSAANSAVCYALGITNADAVQLGLLFERFLSPERDGPPDIDIDIESGRREEAIQYVYAKHGRRHAAQVANVITYRAKSSIRDVAKALGYAPGQQDAWSKQADAWGGVAVTAQQQEVDKQIPEDVLALAAELEHAPRHLGIHSGGMVICDRPIVEVCPVEWARMEDRSVLQWDKDDCAAIGLVKFDLLGLGMLEVLHGCIDLVREVHGDVAVDLATIPQEDEVYDMLCRADSVGVFQVESRAQMATLPRLRPREFYDLVVEVALIRPGPIQGGSVHPYIRRRNGQEEVTYLHPLLERSLEKTLGVPLFQEQLMQMAIDVGGFSPGEADMLRQAMGSKRSRERMERLHQRFADGAAGAGRGLRRHRDHLGEAGRLRQLRLPREPLGELRLPRVRVVVAEALVPGCLLRGPARRPADGLLRPPHPRAGRPPPRRRGPHPRPQRLCRDLHIGGTRHRQGGAGGSRRRSGGGTGRRCGWGSPTCGGSATTWPRRSPRVGPTPTRRTWRAGCPSRSRSSRRWPPAGPSTASGCRGGRRSGRRGRSPRWARTATAPSACRASSPGCRPPICRPWRVTSRLEPTCGPPA